MRIYLPLLRTELADLELPSRNAVAATEEFQRKYHEEGFDIEDYEFISMMVAAGLCKELGADMRIVAAADCEATEVGHGMVQPASLSWEDVVSIHVDGTEGRALVAAGKWEEAGTEALEWYDIVERQNLIAELAD